MDEWRIAWLAGLIDGEGAVGAHRTGRGQIVGCIQMSMTCGLTISTAFDVFKSIGAHAVKHHHQERNPLVHRDAHYLRISRAADLVSVCPRLIPFAVTKRRQLELLHCLAASRLSGLMIDKYGRIANRGRKPYSAEEWEILAQLKALNLRGAQSRPNYEVSGGAHFAHRVARFQLTER